MYSTLFSVELDVIVVVFYVRVRIFEADQYGICIQKRHRILRASIDTVVA